MAREQIFFFGRYSLALHNDGFTFSSGNASFTGKGIKKTQDGVFSFQIDVLPSDFFVGMCYGMDVYDQRLKRTVMRTLWSDVFSWQNHVIMNVEFVPGKTEGNRMTLVNETQVDTFYKTIYGKTVSVILPAGFSFVPACRLNPDGGRVWYFSPDGTAKVVAGGKLRLGLSGSEYVDLKAGEGFGFHSGQPAYIGTKVINRMPTTSYVSFPESGYHTQPQEANYYTPGTIISHAAVLPPIRTGNTVFPSFPYTGMKEGKTLAEKAENMQIAPLRRKRIEDGMANIRRQTEETDSFAMTSNGMKICMNGEMIRWMRVAATETDGPGMAFSEMTTAFYLGLLSNNLLIVLTDLKDRAGTVFMIDRNRLELAAMKGYKDCDRLEALLGTVYTNRDELKNSVEQTGAEFSDILTETFDTFNVRIAGWGFLISPLLWKSVESMFVVKMQTAESLCERIKTPEKLSVSLNDDEMEEARKRLDNVIKENGKLDDGILEKILNDKKWTGCAAFGIQCDIKALPKELGFLKNAINPAELKAVYVAFESQNLKDGDVAAANVLISYEDRNMLTFEDYHEFAFKVRSLRLKIIDGAVRDFQVKIELMVNSLLGCSVSGSDGMYGNSLIFNGSLQNDEEGSYYAFVLESPQTYRLQNCMIENMSVTAASLRTEGNNCRFRLDGNMKLHCNEQMDILSYDSIGFEGVEILMESTADDYMFTTSLKNFKFVTENAQCREKSLAGCFPINIDTFILRGNICQRDRFRDLKINGSVEAEELVDGWSGITWVCSIGNLGGMAESMKFEINVLTAWNKEMKMFCGIYLSSAFAGNRWTMPLQGIMELGFSRIELMKKESENKTEWYFRFRDFSLSVIGKKFPETSNNLYLISDESKNLGFYGVMEG